MRKTIDPQYLPEELQMLTDLIGADAFGQLVDHFGGANLYIPKRETLERNARDYAIRKSYFDGENRQVLARTYHLSERQIRRILQYSAVPKK